MKSSGLRQPRRSRRSSRTSGLSTSSMIPVNRRPQSGCSTARPPVRPLLFAVIPAHLIATASTYRALQRIDRSQTTSPAGNAEQDLLHSQQPRRTSGRGHRLPALTGGRPCAAPYHLSLEPIIRDIALLQQRLLDGTPCLNLSGKTTVSLNNYRRTQLVPVAGELRSRD